MIGDDKVHAEAVRRFRGPERADAHVHADDQTNSRGRGSFDHVIAHVIAFADAVRNVEVGSAATKFDGSLQNDDRHRAVDVVISVDQDWLFAFDSGVEAVDRGAQPGHLLRRVEIGERGRKKTLRLFAVCNTPPDKKRCKDRSRPRDGRATERRITMETSEQRIDQALFRWLWDPLHDDGAVYSIRGCG